MKKISDLNNTPKCFKELKRGDKIYGIKVPYQRNPKPVQIEAVVTDVKIDTSDENEYYGSSVIKFKVDGTGKTGEIYLWARELQYSALVSSNNKFFLTKAASDDYFENNIGEVITSINNDFDYVEQQKKIMDEREKRWAKKEFTSLEDELNYIDEIYDHEWGSTAKNKEMDTELEAAKRAAKEKWAKK